MDPHAAAVGTNLSFLGNIYEGLMRRDKDMALAPALALSWEPLGSDGWRFNLRQGVTFHDGAAFTADDVLFSFERASGEGSDVTTWFASIESVEVVDDFTIDFLTSRPNPLFPNEIANWLIMDRDWAATNNAAMGSKDEPNFARFNTNGTGPFKLDARQADVRTELVANDAWWDTPEHNITRAIYTPITTDATRIAALLSGEADFINPIPLQDVARVNGAAGFSVIEGVETRVIMLGMEQQNDTLQNSGEANPFKDVRVRQAFYHAINIDAIQDRVDVPAAFLSVGPGRDETIALTDPFASS